MTDTLRNSLLMLGVLIGVGLIFLWPILSTRRFWGFTSSQPGTYLSVTQEALNMADLAIPRDGRLSPGERAWFDELHEILDHGTRPVDFVELALTEYVRKCQRDRKLVDSVAVRRLSEDINRTRAARMSQRFDMYGNGVQDSSREVSFTPMGWGAVRPEQAVTVTMRDGTFNGRITSPTTITVDTGTRDTTQIMSLLEDAIQTQNPPRDRTIIWEKEDV